jgi:hypothetical protein
MVKQKKKRTKAYTGVDAKITRPLVTHMTAANRNKAQQWWFEKKQLVKPVGIAVIVAVVVIWLLIELIRIISGSVA